MVNKPLDMKYVYKRSRYIERRKSLNETKNMLDLSDARGQELYKSKIENYINECTSYRYALQLLENLYEANQFNILESTSVQIAQQLIPMLEHDELLGCADLIQISNIGEVNKDRLLETVKMYKSIDRIVENHNILSKRFELTPYLEGYKSDYDRCYAICEMVDTYKTSSYIKFNIALEELAYINSKFISSDMTEESIVENVTNYFLLRNESDSKSINQYKKAILESKVLHDGADERIKYLTNPESLSEVSTLSDELNKWKLNPNKNIDTLVEYAHNNYSNANGLRDILEVIKEYTTINNIEFDSKILFENITNGLSSCEARNIIDFIKENQISNAEDLIDSMMLIWEAEINDDVYADGTKEPQTFTSDEIDKFKVHNLITDAQDAGEFIDRLEKTSMKESPCRINNCISMDDLRRAAEDAKRDPEIYKRIMMDNVDENGYINYNLRSYTYSGDIEKMNKLLESSIKCLNNTLYNSDFTAIYTIDENSFDIALRSNYKVLLTESEEENRNCTGLQNYLLEQVTKASDVLNEIYESPISSIIEKMHDPNYAATVSIDEVESLYTHMESYLMKDTINDFLVLCQEQANPRYDTIKKIMNRVPSYQFNMNNDHKAIIEYCAYNIMHLPKNEEVVQEGNIGNNLRNAVGQVKNAVSSIGRGMEHASNASSAAIGKVAKKFNRAHLDDEVNKPMANTVKKGAALAAIGVAAGPAAALATAAGAKLAKSALTNDKSRRKMLDEIDTELKVIEREIQKAEASGSTDRYRDLLNSQKNLQRKRQEIYFKFAKKGKRMPIASSLGLRED